MFIRPADFWPLGPRALQEEGNSPGSFSSLLRLRQLRRLRAQLARIKPQEQVAGGYFVCERAHVARASFGVER